MRQRRGSFTSQTIIPFSNLSKTEQLEFGSLFKKTDQRDGGVSFYDFIEILKNSFVVSQDKKKEILSEISNKGVRILDFNFLLSTASVLKKQKQQNSEFKQLAGQFFDTFVALGGNPDGSGFITKNNLVNTMLNQFDLKVDLDTIELKGLSQQKLNYDQFCELFQNPQNTLLRTDSVRSVRINPQDFDNYMSKITL